MRDHGGNLDEAQARWGQGDWVDLSTGINRQPYPVSRVSLGAWTNLPTASVMAALMEAAEQAEAAGDPGALLEAVEFLEDLAALLHGDADAGVVDA